LKAWAPAQTEPAFLVAQGGTFILFAVITILMIRKFRPDGLVASSGTFKPGSPRQAAR